MPKTAATMIGLLLAACSIGLNTVRYPIVSEMVGPALARAPSGEPLPPAPAASPAQSEPPSPDDAPPGAATPVEVRPVPDVAGAIADPAPPVANRMGRPSPAAGDGTAGVPPGMERPLAPVSPAAISGGAVRRLPPVDQSPPLPLGRDRQPTEGPIPVYPSTGLR